VSTLLPACRAPSFEEAMRYGTDTYHTLRAIIQKKYGEGQEAPATADCLNLSTI
jgi:enolase